MLHLRVSFDDQEIDRRDLTDSLVIGRWAGCELAVRDILLSRRHCHIAPAGKSAWHVADLGSKNGTLLNGRRLTAIPMPLVAGDELILGRLTLRLAAGSLADAGLCPLHVAPPRPADPSESMTGTFAGFTYLQPGESSTLTTDAAHRPLPRPEPKLPAAYDREDIHSLLAAIASSSWDSIYAQARRPIPAWTAAESVEENRPAPRPRPRTPMDLSLQASPPPEPPVAPRTEPAAISPLGRRHPRRRTRAGGLVWIVLIALLIFRGYFSGRVQMPPRLLAAPIAQAIAPGVPAAAPAPVPPMRVEINAVLVYQMTAPALPFLL